MGEEIGSICNTMCCNSRMTSGSATHPHQEPAGAKIWLISSLSKQNYKLMTFGNCELLSKRKWAI